MNAERVAEYERLTLDQTFDLPVTQFLNDLQYLKLRDEWKERATRKARPAI